MTEPKCKTCGGALHCMTCLGRRGGRSKSPRKITAARRTLRLVRESERRVTRRGKRSKRPAA